jgi:glycosyltransferase involved in cell wall biosynthesis
MIICSPQMGISPNSSMGGTVHDREILNALGDLGVKIYLTVPTGEDVTPINNWYIYPSSRHKYYYYEYNLRFLKAVNKSRRIDKFDILRIHSPTLIPLGIFFKKIYGVKTCINIHHLDSKFIPKMLLKYSLSSFDLVTTGSNYSARKIANEFHITPESIGVTYNGVGEQYRKSGKNLELLRKYNIIGESMLLLYLGALETRKNLFFLIDVFITVLSKRNYFHLVIAGEGSLKQKLIMYTHKMGLSDKVHFTGYLKEVDKIKHYNSADIFIFPSLLEGFGLSPIEAMACGLPVVASNSSSLPEIIGEHAILADPHNKNNFANAILTLSEDENLYSQMSTSGQIYVKERYSWDRSARIYLDYLNQLIR